MAKSPVEVARKWQANLSASIESIKNGVNAVTEAPTERAARRVDAMVAGVQRAASEGKIQDGLRRVTLADWQRAMTEKGVGRIATGAAAAQPKVAAFLTEFLPHVEEGQRRLDSMPRGDLETNLQRAVAMMRHNATFRRRR